jgi:hypothetical protein
MLVVVLELRSQMEYPKCLSNRKYPTKDIMALLALQNDAHFRQSHSVQHEPENMDNATINAEQNHWAV